METHYNYKGWLIEKVYTYIFHDPPTYDFHLTPPHEEYAEMMHMKSEKYIIDYIEDQVK